MNYVFQVHWFKEGSNLPPGKTEDTLSPFITCQCWSSGYFHPTDEEKNPRKQTQGVQ